MMFWSDELREIYLSKDADMSGWPGVSESGFYLSFTYTMGGHEENGST